MRKLFAARTVLPLPASVALVWIVASCASQGEETPRTAVDDGGQPDTSTVITGPDAAGLEACTDGRWCAVTPPIPAPVSLNGIWGSGPNDVWIVGSPDFAIHWDGAKFTSARLDTNHTLFGIWGGSPTDVWAFSTGHVVWHNASGDPLRSAWSAFDKDAGGEPVWTGPIHGMWGRGPTDVWAVGQSLPGSGQATVWHSEGWGNGLPNWVASTTTPGAEPWDSEPNFNAVWGSDRGEVWVVGDRGKTRCSSGWKDGAATWVVVDSGTSLPLYALWGADREVWAAGAGGVVRRFTRQTDDTIAVQDVAFPSSATIRTLFGFTANDIWAAGSDGTLAHWDGSTWSLVPLEGAASSSNEIFALWASGPHDIWAVGRNTLLHKGSTLLPGTTP